MLKQIILISLILSILPLVSAVEISNTLFVNTVTNYSIYINETVYMDALNITDEGRIEFYNLVSNSTTRPILYNNNDTYISVIDLYQLTNALITYKNGSVVCSNVYDCSGNINVTLKINDYIRIFNNYNTQTGDTPSNPQYNDPISESTTGSGTNQSTILNNTLNALVTFGISGLNNALIFNNSYNIYGSSVINDNDGNINLTIGDDEIIYILNNYEKSELYSRNLDPIWFSSSSNTEKHIASNLSDTVNVTVIFNVKDCDTIGSITYRTNSGNYTQNYTKSGGWFYVGDSFTCSNNIVTLVLPIENAENSNEINIYYNAGSLNACNASLNAFMSYITFLGLLGIIIFFGWMFAYMFGLVDKETFKQVNIIGSLTILILLGVLLIISIFIFSTLCSVF